MFKLLLPAAAALGLIAFAAQSQGAASEPDVEMTTPVMSWSVHREGDLAKLTYGVANSDQLALMVSCTPGQSTAEVYGDVTPETAVLTRASLTPAPLDPLSGGAADETRIRISDPVLTGLARNGRMPVVADAGRFQLTADRQERRLVGEFLAYCSSGRV